MSAAPPRIAAIAIGRNEGARLERCLASLRRALGTGARIVYVDSGSTDGSPGLARGHGAELVALDMGRPFTAARARNAGLAQLREGGARPDMVLFIDGDCELRPGFVPAALAAFAEEADLAVACGRRRERFPGASIYNAHCDREWDTPVGEARACGGDALMRMAALDQVGGYDPTLIAGEEPEMCVRLRARGWRVRRIAAEMTLHDADMHSFAQFRRRARRAGHAFAEGAHLHGAPPERHYVAQARRALLWGAALPAAILVLALVVGPWALLLLLVYPLRAARLALRAGGGRAAWENAALLLLGKFPEARGVLEFHLRRLSGRRSGLIEYK